ncbi:MAG: hypothetical protein ACI4AE_00220 [Candidatus Cryptobacteroides sp.]
MTEYNSKHAVVRRAPYELYMAFVDLRNFVQFLPEDKKKDVTADFDTLTATVQGFSIGVMVHERVPYSKISFIDYGNSPFAFKIDFHFDSNNGAQNETDFHIDVEADLNFMMKTMLGGKIKSGLDKIVDSLAAISEGRMPEGIDPSMFPGGFTKNQ